MVGIKYFGHLEHYCFEKNYISDFFGRSVTSPMTSYIFMSYNSHTVPIFCLFGIF